MLTKRAGYAWAPGDRSNTGDAYLDAIVWQIVPEARVRTGSLQSGQVAGIGGVPPQDIETLRNDGFQLVSRPNPGITFGLSAVADHAPLGDALVRQAIAAGDRRHRRARHRPQPRLRRGDQRALADHPRAGRPSSELIAYDPDAAGALLDQAGWTLGSRRRPGEGRPEAPPRARLDRPTSVRTRPRSS